MIRRTEPCAGDSGALRNIGSSNRKPSQRAGKPRGSSIHNTPNMPATMLHGGGACCVQTACGRLFSHSSNTIVQPITLCANHSGASIGSTAPSKASGTTTKLTSGIAKVLAMGETSETCWNSASSMGIRPMVIAPLHLAVFHQPVFGFQAICRDVQDQCHCAERQPEAGRQDCPWVGNQHAEQRDAEYLPERKIAIQPQCCGDYGDHIHGALRRYGETGQQRVAECYQQSDQRGGFARRQEQGKTCAAPP